ncbi:hypothetical protein BC828DRAFT_208112 [Blastocladiella britannica]|nr:hypothetical protein BC828DRAFT_208112 [Blastocladiella britannica]
MLYWIFGIIFFFWLQLSAAMEAKKTSGGSQDRKSGRSSLAATRTQHWSGRGRHNQGSRLLACPKKNAFKHQSQRVDCCSSHLVHSNSLCVNGQALTTASMSRCRYATNGSRTGSVTIGRMDFGHRTIVYIIMYYTRELFLSRAVLRVIPVVNQPVLLLPSILPAVCRASFLLSLHNARSPVHNQDIQRVQNKVELVSPALTGTTKNKTRGQCQFLAIKCCAFFDGHCRIGRVV